MGTRGTPTTGSGTRGTAATETSAVSKSTSTKTDAQGEYSCTLSSSHLALLLTREDSPVSQFAEKKKEKDPGDITLPLRVLQLLCEGHNSQLQDLLVRRYY